MAPLADPYLIVGIAAFLIGLILLSRTKAKRYLMFFMLETKHGLRFVDKVARLSPYVWKFVGDVAIVVSFGGFGAYYVSRYRNTRFITGLLGAFCLILTYLNFGPMLAFAGLLVLAAGVYLLKRFERPVIQLIAAAIVMGAILFNVYPTFFDVAFLKPYVSILFGVFGVPSLLISMLFSQALKIVLLQSNIPGVSPLLPTVGEEGLGFFFPGTGIFIPFWQALIAIIALLVPHELAHGILARSHKIRLKSAGIITAGPIPIGAFVEPDEKGLKLYKSRGRMRIYAIGSFTNLIVAIASLILLIFVMAPLISVITESTGMIINNVAREAPAYGILQKGFVIKEINGMPTNDVQAFNLAISTLKPNQTVPFVTSNGTFNITVSGKPGNASKPYVGVDLQETFKIKDDFQNKYKMQADTVLFFTPTLFWVFFLSFNVALVNLLPIVPFDGGKMFEEIMTEFRVKRKTKEMVANAVLVIIFALLLINASPLLFNLVGS